MRLVICMMWFLSGSVALAADGWTTTKNRHIPVVLDHLKAGDLERAEAELKLARAYEGTSMDLGLLAILEGMVAALNADEAQARAAFTRALVIDSQLTLPDSATPYSRKIFDAARVEAKKLASTAASAPSTGSARNLPAEFEQKYSAGKLEEAEAFLKAAGAQSGVGDSGAFSILTALMQILKELQAGMSPEQCRSYADDLRATEAKLVEELATKKVSSADAAQFSSLRGLMLMVSGVLRVESGEEKLARASFKKALEVNPDAKLPSIASAKARRLFKETKAAAPAGRKP